MSAIPLHLHFHCAKKMIPAIPHFYKTWMAIVLLVIFIVFPA
uniref:Uncharacterized protein n=1 Tax=Anguilla anguilla TaxID=7936 RepID=A0A0E9V2I7_ANGAN